MSNLNNLYSKKVMEHFQHPKNMGEIKNADGVATVGNPVCTPPDSLILANDRVLPINQIKIESRVLGHDGYYHKVKKVYKRNYSGKLTLLRTHNLGEVALTPDHHVLALKSSLFSHKFEAFRKGKILLDWFNASQLEKGDILLYPIPKEIVDINILDFDFIKSKWDFRSKNIPKKIIVDGDFLRLVGYYLAEGYLGTQVTRKVCGFTFGNNEEEKEYINDVISLVRKVFNIDPSPVVIKNNSTNLVYYSSQLVEFFLKQFSKGAESKHLPHWIMLLPVEKQKHILCGIWRGDGYISKKKKVSKFVTISERLAFQVRSLLLRQGIIFSFLINPPKGIHKKSYSFYVKEDKSLKKIAEIVGEKMGFPENKKSPKKTWYDENYYYSTIWKTEEINYQGQVFNLGVEDVASYVTQSAILHNCGDVMRMFLKIDKKNGEEIIKDAKFQTLGCGAAIATSSIATEMIKGKPVKDAQNLTNKAIAEALGGLPPVKMHCSVLAAEAVKKAIEDYRSKVNGK